MQIATAKRLKRPLFMDSHRHDLKADKSDAVSSITPKQNRSGASVDSIDGRGRADRQSPTVSVGDLVERLAADARATVNRLDMVFASGARSSRDARG